VLFVAPGQKTPAVRAEIRYNGTGRLKGRWEVVRPGDEQPEARDLLTEATLPAEERGLQRRYTELSRFNVFLPPTGRFVLPGPDPARLPNRVAGQYQILLRIEASDDREADSDLAAVGAGGGVVHSGGVAGFPLPTLRYVVGGGNNAPAAPTADRLALLLPGENRTLPRNAAVDFTWAGTPAASFYRLEVEDVNAKQILSALLPRGVTGYRAPSWLKERAGEGSLRWRVVALDQAGAQADATAWRSLRLVPVQ
jgi:hypothetical protein